MERRLRSHGPATIALAAAHLGRTLNRSGTAELQVCDTGHRVCPIPTPATHDYSK